MSRRTSSSLGWDTDISFSRVLCLAWVSRCRTPLKRSASRGSVWRKADQAEAASVQAVCRCGSPVSPRAISARTKRRFSAGRTSSCSGSVIANLDDAVAHAHREAMHALVCGRLERLACADGKLSQVPGADGAITFHPTGGEVPPHVGAQVLE